ncbi:MAG: YsnF/AvaK domain-containing protein [Pyrinomonadaceae bacterium]|nr:YsnF/AvaK domain-containing protein [Pyrinomonadaceae bacterium]
MAQTVVGLFDTKAEAQNAVDDLLKNGFTQDQIDVTTEHLNDANTTTTTNQNTDQNIGDSISNFFSSLFGDDDDTTNRYNKVARDTVVVTVHVNNQPESANANRILDEYGSVDVDERYTQNYASTTKTDSTLTNQQFTDTNSARNVTDGTRNVTDGTAIPIVEEQLQVGKQVVEGGGVKVRSRVIEKPVEEHLRLREERVRVERHAVNRPATDADLTAFKEGEMTITEHSEVPIVNKQSNVVEEVNVGTEITERDETIRDTVRRTDVEVDELTGDTKTRSTNS